MWTPSYLKQIWKMTNIEILLIMDCSQQIKLFFKLIYLCQLILLEYGLCIAEEVFGELFWLPILITRISFSYRIISRNFKSKNCLKDSIKGGDFSNKKMLLKIASIIQSPESARFSWWKKQCDAFLLNLLSTCTLQQMTHIGIGEFRSRTGH